MRLTKGIKHNYSTYNSIIYLKILKKIKHFIGKYKLAKLTHKQRLELTDDHRRNRENVHKINHSQKLLVSVNDFLTAKEKISLLCKLFQDSE